MRPFFAEAAFRIFAERGPDAPVIDEFVQAAGIARGTFYNHFRSVEQLLRATSAWTTRELLRDIREAIADIKTPALRLGVGMRLFFARAQRDPVWCRFVAQVWRVGGLDMPGGDLYAAIGLGQFRSPSREVAYDVLFGAVRQALHRIGEGRVPAAYGDQVTEACLYALRADRRQITAVLERALPPLPDRARERAADDRQGARRGPSRRRV